MDSTAGKKAKVLVYEPYPFGKVAGNLRTLHYILKFLDRERVEPLVVVPFATELLERVSELGVAAEVLEPPARLQRYGGRCLRSGWLDRLGTVADLFRYAGSIRAFIREHAIDVVYCNGIRSVLTVGLAARLAGVPVLWYVKGRLEHRLFDTLGYLFASRIVFYSEQNSRDRYPLLRRLFDRKVEIVKTGLDWEDVERVSGADHAPLKEEFELSADDFNIAYVGQLYAPKGVHFLLEALAGVVEQVPRIRLFVIGDGIIDEYQGYVSELKAMVAERGLRRHVVFTGWREDAMELVSLMNAVVHPSLAEGFARSVLEAMALGKAVVATGVGGERDTIVDGVNGFLVAPGDAEAIAGKLRLLGRDEAEVRRMGDEARATILRDHRIGEKVAQLGELFVRLAAGGGGR